MGFSKLFSDLIMSSIWNEDDTTRIVWITILATKNGSHVVRSTIGGLAHAARVSIEGCRKAIEKLSSPDPDGLDQPYQGRRIRAVEHGWYVLNGEVYKRRRDEDDWKAYQAEWARNNRAKKKLAAQGVDHKTSIESIDASIDVDTVDVSRSIRSDQIRLSPNGDSPNSSSNGEKRTKLAGPEFWESLKSDTDYAGIDFNEERRKMSLWKKLPRNSKRQITETFVRRWLAKAERQVELPTVKRSMQCD